MGEDAIRGRPKIELHVHLEGALRAASVPSMAARHDSGSPFARADWQVGYWTFSDLAGFLAQVDPLLRACMRDADDWYRAAVECFEDLAAQDVIYAEPSIAARLPGRPGYLPIETAVAAVEAARQEVCAKTQLRVGLIVGFSRHAIASLGADGPRLAYELIQAVARTRATGAHVVGVDLHGDEQSLTDLSPLEPAFDLARQAGLMVRVHAGEAAGAESVWSALRQLRPDRIGHGVRAAEDPVLVRYLAQHAIALDVCPTSNLRTGASTSRSQPLRQLFDAGVPVSVSTDDPLAFETSLSTEIGQLLASGAFNLAEVGQLMFNAAAHAFQPAMVRAALLDQIRAGWPIDP